MNYVWAFLFVPIYQVYWKISRIESHLTQVERKKGKKSFQFHSTSVSRKLLHPFSYLPVGNHCLILTNCFSIFHDKQFSIFGRLLRCQTCTKSISILFFVVVPNEKLLFIVFRHIQKVTSWSDVHPAEAEMQLCVHYFAVVQASGMMLLSDKTLIQCPSRACLTFYQIKFFFQF